MLNPVKSQPLGFGVMNETKEPRNGINQLDLQQLPRPSYGPKTLCYGRALRYADIEEIKNADAIQPVS